MEAEYLSLARGAIATGFVAPLADWFEERGFDAASGFLSGRRPMGLLLYEVLGEWVASRNPIDIRERFYLLPDPYWWGELLSIRMARHIRISQRVYGGPCMMQTMFAPCEVDEMHLRLPENRIGFQRLRLVRRLTEPKELVLACLVVAGLSAEKTPGRSARNHFCWYRDEVPSGSSEGDLVRASSIASDDAVCSEIASDRPANAVVIDVRHFDRRVRVELL